MAHWIWFSKRFAKLSEADTDNLSKTKAKGKGEDQKLGVESELRWNISFYIEEVETRLTSSFHCTVNSLAWLLLLPELLYSSASIHLLILVIVSSNSLIDLSMIRGHARNIESQTPVVLIS